MFFNFGLQDLADFNKNFDTVAFEKELAALASVATAAAVNSPAVVDSPKNTAPQTAAVQAVVNQVVAAVAPVVAPTVPAKVISKLEPIVTDAVVTNPKVVSSGAGVTVPATATTQIANTISTTFKSDAQKDAELANAIKTAVPQPGTTATTTAKPDAVTQPGTTATTTAKPDAVNLPFDTTKPATSVTMPFDTTKPATTVNLSTTTATATAAANVQTAQKFSGDGTKTRPLLADGKAFTGTRNGIEYKDGLPVSATRADILEADRNAAEAAETAKRAATNPLYDPTNRPQGAIDNGYIVYWSWIGGRTNGEWKQYRAPVTPENMAKYGSRVFPGSTQATFENVTGTTALGTQPMPTYDKNGNITGYTLGGATLTSTGLTGVTTSGTITGTTTGGTTTGTTTGGATTGVTTGGTTTGTTTGGTTTGAITGGTGVTGSTTGITDPGTLALIKSLQDQIAALTAGNQQSAVDKAAADAAAKKEKAENAIAVLTDRFTRYGLASLVPKIKELAIGGASESTITLQLQESEEYRQRFRANQDRIKKGLSVLDPGDYLGLEDKYRQILRAYGLSQFDNDNYVTQFISNDVSTAELSSRVQTAVQRIQNADPAILTTLTKFYGIGTNDLVGYVLDPENQVQKIERQVAAAEIGAAAKLQGFDTGSAVAEQLAAQGISQAEAQKGYATIADILPTAEKLSQIYSNTEQAYGLAEAEQEVFNTLASAQRKRRKLAEREVASFSGSSGLSKASLTSQIGGNI